MCLFKIMELCGAIIPQNPAQNPAHKKIYAAILTMDVFGMSSDLISISDSLKASGQLDEVGGELYLNSLFEYMIRYAIETPRLMG